ncbi:cytochrome P450 [Myxococcota bacterium]|nr:cytochrome P450 [Myxococcota bacterium]
MPAYDPYMPEVLSDPNSVYARMRAESPVYYVERFDAWALFEFEDIWQASQDTLHYSVRNATSDLSFLEREPAAMETLASVDPPRHKQLRKEAFPHFSPRSARSLEPHVRKWTRQCIEKHRDLGQIDAIRELGQQIAVRVACVVNGFPLEDSDYLVDLVSRFFLREEGTEGMSDEGFKARQETWDYLEQLVRSRLESPDPGDDVLGVLAGFADDRGPFTPELIAQHLTLLLIGATETFPKVFATGLLRLWEHPDQRRLLCDDPNLIDDALTEILRYDMPTQWLGRTAIADHEIRGHAIRENQPVLFVYPSGNRDPKEFDEPDRFDVRRRASRILTFGHGTHRCLGSFMARMEGRVLLQEILREFPEYEVMLDDCERLRTEFVQGYAKFPITLR